MELYRENILHSNQFKLKREKSIIYTYCICFVAGVSSMLNSATGTLRRATCGANIAAGYTIAEVPMTKQASQLPTMLTVTILFYSILKLLFHVLTYACSIYDQNDLYDLYLLKKILCTSLLHLYLLKKILRTSLLQYILV